MADIILKKGDRLPSMTATLVDADGVMNLTGATSVTFAMQLLTAGLPVGTVYGGACTVTDAAGGVVRYDWSATDTLVAGDYYGEFVALIGGKEQTFPNEGYLAVTIKDDIAA